MSFSDVEHFATILSGCEAISLGQYKDPDAAYASSVLQLHANDMGSYAGQEGFMEGIKKGAAKTGEFVKKLLEAIRKWFAEVFKSTKSKVAGIFGKGDEEEKKAEAKKIAGSMVSKVEAVKKAAEGVPEGVSAKGVVDACDKVISAFKEDGRPASIVLAVNSLLDEIDKTSASYLKLCNSLAPKKEIYTPKYESAVKQYKQFAAPTEALTRFITETYSKTK